MAKLAQMTLQELEGKTISEIKAIVHEDIAFLERFDRNSLQSFLYVLLGGIATATNIYRGKGQWQIKDTSWIGFKEAEEVFHAEIPSYNQHVGNGFVTTYYVDNDYRGVLAKFPNLYMGEDNGIIIMWLLELKK